MSEDNDRPAVALLLAEAPRALFERLSLVPSRPLLRWAPRGDGHPVLVLPGFATGDGSTRVLRRTLHGFGYRAHPWLQGLNLGVQEGLPERLARRAEELHARYGRRLSLVGWSLGGIYARELAKRRPGLVRQVITLGSPFAARSAGLRQPPPAPTTSIYTRSDGIVHWSRCVENETDRTESIEVPGSHCGLGFNPLVLYAIADRLGQPEGEWRPFDRSGWRRSVYGRRRPADD